MIFKVSQLSGLGGPSKVYPNFLSATGIAAVFRERVADVLLFNGTAQRSDYFMITQFCQVGDVGVALVVQLLQPDGTPWIVGSATDLIIRLELPDTTGVEFSAELYSDGNDGKIMYVTKTGDLPLPGIYRIQGKVKVGTTVIKSGEPEPFEVIANTPDPVS